MKGGRGPPLPWPLAGRVKKKGKMKMEEERRRWKNSDYHLKKQQQQKQFNLLLWATKCLGKMR